jgi:uncharacterized protein YqjF (DUF2071 family)
MSPPHSRHAEAQRASLDTRAHRPWPVPEGRWLIGQTWRALAFLHWPVPVDALRRLVPSALPLDVYEDHAWLGITPFDVVGHRLRGLPAVPIVSRFRELNVRTYVTLAGRPGIHFFSLDASSVAAVLGARASYRLPYRLARMHSDTERAAVHYRSARLTGPSAELVARYVPSGAPFNAVPGTLEHWLTERYCLYVTGPDGAPVRADIHHPPWDLQPAEVELTRNTMADPLDLRLDGHPHALFAARQDVLIWPPSPVSGG